MDVRHSSSTNFLRCVPRSSDLVAELPFILMHPKPEDDEPALAHVSNSRLSLKPGDAADKQANGGIGSSNEDPNCEWQRRVFPELKSNVVPSLAAPITANLIQLDG